MCGLQGNVGIEKLGGGHVCIVSERAGESGFYNYAQKTSFKQVLRFFPGVLSSG